MTASPSFEGALREMGIELDAAKRATLMQHL